MWHTIPIYLTVFIYRTKCKKTNIISCSLTDFLVSILINEPASSLTSILISWATWTEKLKKKKNVTAIWQFNPLNFEIERAQQWLPAYWDAISLSVFKHFINSINHNNRLGSWNSLIYIKISCIFNTNKHKYFDLN